MPFLWSLLLVSNVLHTAFYTSTDKKTESCFFVFIYSRTFTSFTSAVSNSFLSPGKISHGCRHYFGMIFLFVLIMICCLYSLESPRSGDSNENTQYILILKKLEKKLLCLLTWRISMVRKLFEPLKFVIDK